MRRDAPPPPTFRTVEVAVDVATGVGTLRLNRPAKSNALDADMWREIPAALDFLDAHDRVRAVVLCAAGKNFCAGIDVSTPESLSSQLGGIDAATCPGRRAEALYRHVRRLQDSFTALERCRAPVVCAIQGACFGGGVDMAVACDVRVCAEDARFCVKEVDLAITADIGTLQRLPTLVGHGVAAEMALTARVVGAEEARRVGLVSDVVRGASGPGDVEARARELAVQIAAKSPLAVQGTKAVMLHARDHAVGEGLEFVAHVNAARLASDDLGEATAAMFERRKPVFSKL